MMIEATFRAARAAGHKILLPYVTGGITDDWIDYLDAFADAGADAIEVGLPFSDPMLDGVTIQEASDRALARGVDTGSILAALGNRRTSVPLIAMTYANLVLRFGVERFCSMLQETGVGGLIVPDLPLSELGDLEGAAADAGIELVLLCAPATTPGRLLEIAQRSRGFVYAVSRMDTTGERGELAATAAVLAHRVRAVTDRPVLLGFGVSSPAQAAEAARHSDGVVVASALMRRVLDGGSPAEVAAHVAQLRRALAAVEGPAVIAPTACVR